MTLKQEIEDASRKLVEELRKLSKPITTLEEKKHVARISAANEKIGDMVAEAVNKVGPEGIVTIEESKSIDTYVDYKQGFEFDRGFYSQYFVTNGDKDEAVIEDPHILITDIKINRSHQIVPFLENLFKNNIKNLVIIGEVQEEALATLVVNKLRGAINVVAVQAPAF